jgi:PHD-zinc-finger like domain
VTVDLKITLVGNCRLCGSKDLLPMQGEKRNWYHMACLALNTFMVSEARLKFDSRFVTIEPASNESTIAEEALPCTICGKSEGLIHTCSFASVKEFESQSTVEGTQTSKCNSRFHPLCAYFVDYV